MAGHEIRVERTDEIVLVWNTRKKKYVNEYVYLVLEVKGDVFLNHKRRKRTIREGDKVLSSDLRKLFGVPIYYV